MKKLIPALVAALIAAPAVAADYDGGPTKGWAASCSTFLRYTQDPPPEDWSFEGANDGKQCWWHVLHWLWDTNRYKGKPGPDETELVLGRCGAQIILRHNDDTPVYDALAAEFDTACGTLPLATPDDPLPMYYDGMTKDMERPCTLFLRYSTPLPPSQAIPDHGTVTEKIQEGRRCSYAVLAWLDDTGRTEGKLDLETEIALARCGAQIILSRNDDTPIADALGLLFDTFCEES